MTPLQKFNLLSNQQREEILDKYRQWNVDHVDWWDNVYESFKSDMEAIGISVYRMKFSGFWSQGDGACFEGAVEDWGLFLTSMGYSDAALIYAAETFDWSFNCNYKHVLYSNHKSVSYGGEINLPDSVDDHYFADRYIEWGPDDIRTIALMTHLSKYAVGNQLSEEFMTLFENCMLDLYKRLYKEYEHLTSNEVVLETLEVNEMLGDVVQSFLESTNA